MDIISAATQALSATDSFLWNGPVCTTCGRGYCGTHQCSIDDLQARIDGLQRKIDELRANPPVRQCACVIYGRTVCTCAPSVICWCP